MKLYFATEDLIALTVTWYTYVGLVSLWSAAKKER